VTASDIKCINRLVIYGLEFPAPVPMADDLSVLSNSIPLKIKNLTAQSVNDTLKWTVPENWTLEPAKTVVNVQPGDSLALNFTVSNNRKPYPLPKASLKFEYSKDKKSPVDKELPVARKITCTRAATPPVIDGILSDPCWKNPVRQFFSIDGSPMVTDSVYFYFSYDNENLYLAALCKDKKIEEMVSKITEKDGEVYTDDNVGYFIAPSRKSKETYQIIFNPLGTSFDQKVVIDAMGNFNDDINWNSTYDVKTTWAAGYWIFEGRFPVSQFKESLKPGDEFGINFRRKQPRLKNSANFQIPLSYDPESYGILLMAE
jgi:hypothetical protein